MLRLTLAAVMTSLLLATCGAQAAAGAWSDQKEVSARLVSAVGGTGDLATIPAGLEIKLDGDWKTYWRSPGDAGLPPTLDCKGSRNLASARLLYAAPQRVTVLGIQTFGHKHHVLFPLDLKLAETGKPLNLKLHLDILVCAEQCIHIAQRLNTPTISMQADWTRPDADIGAYLASYGRYGIPFNVVYGPAAPGGIVLPGAADRRRRQRRAGPGGRDEGVIRRRTHAKARR